MAFVIVQHLDPTHKGIMPELLQRGTAMKVIQVKDRTKVRPDCVYVIPPNKDMSHPARRAASARTGGAARAAPADRFFLPLAGAGSARAQRRRDPLGHGLATARWACKAIKEQAGVVLVQEPASAKFDGMPRSAIDAGLADIVAPVAELPGADRGVSAAHAAARATAKTRWKQRRGAASGKSGHPAAQPDRPRLFALQTEHALPPDRAAHGHAPDQHDGGLRPLSAGESAGAGSALQGIADRRDELFPRSGGVGAVAR